MSHILSIFSILHLKKYSQLRILSSSIQLNWNL